MKKDPGKHWSPKGTGRPSYTATELLKEGEIKLASCLIQSKYRGDIRVDIEWLGEGRDGDFDPADPNDVPLVRFTIYDYDREEDDQVYDTYCTQVPATMPLAMLESFACALARRLEGEESWKRLVQEWSWSDEKDVRRMHEKRMADRAKKP